MHQVHGLSMTDQLPVIPAKRYFTIGEVAELCGVKPHVLRYWEQEFSQLRPMKRTGNRRYYQHHEVLMIRRIRELLWEQGFTISGARNQLQEAATAARGLSKAGQSGPLVEWGDRDLTLTAQDMPAMTWVLMRQELEDIKKLLVTDASD